MQPVSHHPQNPVCLQRFFMRPFPQPSGNFRRAVIHKKPGTFPYRRIYLCPYLTGIYRAFLSFTDLPSFRAFRSIQAKIYAAQAYPVQHYRYPIIYPCYQIISSPSLPCCPSAAGSEASSSAIASTGYNSARLAVTIL